MGLHERLCRMLALPVPAPDVLAEEEDIVRELARLDYDKRQVAGLLAPLYGDRDVLARFRATAPTDRDVALREVACALQGMVTTERSPGAADPGEGGNPGDRARRR